MLEGVPLVASRAPRLRWPLPGAGAVVTEVEVRGKHLLLHFDDGHVLHTHMRMSGSWIVHRRGQRWQKSPTAARVVLETAEHVVVCFSAPVVELLDDRAVRRHPVLRELGPDLCLPDVDLDDVAARLERLVNPSRILGEVLLDQRVAAGIGNVYKSEVAFLHRLHPLLPFGRVPTDDRLVLWATAARLLRQNLTTRRRTTVPDAPEGTLWVYDRTGRPCRVDDTAVVQEPSGRDLRLTWWCPTCQDVTS